MLAPPPSGVTVDTPAQADSALTMLGTLAVKGRAPMTGYTREQFGPSWTDDVNVPGGHNGCDTRNDVLRRDLVRLVIKPGSNGCTVQSGTLYDPYTAKVIPFARGVQTSTAVQIDHVVALGNAWATGAQNLSAAERTQLANDPINLQATDGPTNTAKGDGDAATWLPPQKSFRCTYVARQVAVKSKYRLWVTLAERNAIAGLLRGCGATVALPPATAGNRRPAPRRRSDGVQDPRSATGAAAPGSTAPQRLLSADPSRQLLPARPDLRRRSIAARRASTPTAIRSRASTRARTGSGYGRDPVSRSSPRPATRPCPAPGPADSRGQRYRW